MLPVGLRGLTKVVGENLMEKLHICTKTGNAVYNYKYVEGKKVRLCWGIYEFSSKQYHTYLV